ncbi:hypothetical protein D9Q98_003181 [Chlorella vulgaris]|uniref:Uncharacterized protein n=1 Tax=Chlorella vulgaris TaxID=3077 RepID=A0A9D4TS04_CHLVU|nr:hypothetical protein D9Q98_003181 [Chlorella vulgaris]
MMRRATESPRPPPSPTPALPAALQIPPELPVDLSNNMQAAPALPVKADPQQRGQAVPHEAEAEAQASQPAPPQLANDDSRSDDDPTPENEYYSVEAVARVLVPNTRLQQRRLFLPKSDNGAINVPKLKRYRWGRILADKTKKQTALEFPWDSLTSCSSTLPAKSGAPYRLGTDREYLKVLERPANAEDDLDLSEEEDTKVGKVLKNLHQLELVLEAAGDNDIRKLGNPSIAVRRGEMMVMITKGDDGWVDKLFEGGDNGNDVANTLMRLSHGVGPASSQAASPHNSDGGSSGFKGFQQPAASPAVRVQPPRQVAAAGAAKTTIIALKEAASDAPASKKRSRKSREQSAPQDEHPSENEPPAARPRTYHPSEAGTSAGHAAFQEPSLSLAGWVTTPTQDQDTPPASTRSAPPPAGHQAQQMQQPAVQPANQPANQPAEQPADQPAVQPAVQPAEVETAADRAARLRADAEKARLEQARLEQEAQEAAAERARLEQEAAEAVAQAAQEAAAERARLEQENATDRDEIRDTDDQVGQAMVEMRDRQAEMLELERRLGDLQRLQDDEQGLIDVLLEDRDQRFQCIAQRNQRLAAIEEEMNAL